MPLDRSHGRRGDGSSKRPFIESGPRQHVDSRHRPSAIEDGEIFVDGGLVNTLPVDVMKRLCPGKVVAVDVSEQVEFQSALQESYGLSGWDLFWRRLDPSEYSLPRDYSRRDRRHRGRALADVCIEPPVNDFGIFDWRKTQTLVDAGYRHALAAKRLQSSENTLRVKNDGAQRSPISSFRLAIRDRKRDANGATEIRDPKFTACANDIFTPGADRPLRRWRRSIFPSARQSRRRPGGAR